MSKKKMIFVKGMTMMLTIIFFACTEEVPVTGVKLDKTILTLTGEETAVLKATVTPANATVSTVTWSAEPADAVTLNADGNRCTVIPVKNGTVTVTASVESVKADCTIESRVYIDNPAFITAVGNQCQWTKESNGTVKVTATNREAMAGVQELNINGYNLTDLSGIEYFTGLTKLNCSGNQLTELNVSDCTALMNLNCSGNQLTELNVSDCMSLINLDCSGNQLTKLDVSGCTMLMNLNCFDNQLTELDVSKNTNLINLPCSGNRLTTLNVTKNTELTHLSCIGNRLTELDVSKNTKLTDLLCGNQIILQALTLTVTNEQKETWDNNWKNLSGNENVNAVIAM